MRITLLTLLGVSLAATQDKVSAIKNPYYEKTEWRLWAVDSATVDDANVAIPPKTKERATIEAVPQAQRLYPGDGFLQFSTTPSKKYAGMADDVYASWSGDHGWVRDRWAGPGGHEVKGVRSSILQFIDGDPEKNIYKLGINFYHQSTTGMGHTIANAVQPGKTAFIEKLYFASGLVTAPAHVSFTEENATFADRTNDLYLAYNPTYFNSLGSSDSETMTITKMIIAGAYLSPEMKLKLKRNGLYASAMLYLWKAALPFDAPYDSEWRHRITYKSVGDRFAFPGGYGAAGIERGDMALDTHRYDDVEHLRRMVEMAKAMTVAPPEAILKVLDRQGGTERYSLKKTLCVVQEPGETVELRISAEDSYDLDNRPLTFRWKLLYGTKSTSVEREGTTNVWKIKVPWDETLPEGRTTLILVANNGAHDGNPAAVNIWRHRTKDMPDTGAGYTDYKYDATFANRRPVIVGLQDVVARPGETLRIPIRAIDPEGFPISFLKRSGEPGAFDGSDFVWDVPKNEPPGERVLTVVASDGTSGNSYEAHQIRLHIAPKVLAQIKADVVTGPAPLTVKFSSEGSGDGSGKPVSFAWAFQPRTPGPPKMPKEEATTPAVAKTFDKPGRYEVWLKVKGPSGEDTACMIVYAAEKAPAAKAAKVAVEGNGADVGATASTFTGTDFGLVKGGASSTLPFIVKNLGTDAVDLGKTPVTVTNTAEFAVVRQPRPKLEGLGSSAFSIRFTPKGPGVRKATVAIKGTSFEIAGTADIDQASVDKAAAPEFAAAKSLADQKQYAKAIAALKAFLEKWGPATQAADAKALLEKLEADPAVKAAIEAQDKAAKEAAARDAADKEARVLWNLAGNYESSGLMDKARELWQKIVDKYPTSSFAAKAKDKLK